MLMVPSRFKAAGALVAAAAAAETLFFPLFFFAPAAAAAGVAPSFGCKGERNSENPLNM